MGFNEEIWYGNSSLNFSSDFVAKFKFASNPSVHLSGKLNENSNLKKKPWVNYKFEIT